MVEVFVSRLGLDSSSSSFVVILQEKSGERIVPIWIGRAEAESIAAHLNGVRRERPMTHDLCQAIIRSLGGTLQAVHVTRVENSTFYAELHVRVADDQHVIDARPSDGIAIALRLEAPIFVAEDLLVEYESPAEGGASGESEDAEVTGGPEFGSEGESEGPAAPEALDQAAEQLKRHLEQLRPEDFGKFSL